MINFTVEFDPRRVDEDRLIYNHEVCGANRISFGMQDLDQMRREELIDTTS